MRKVVLKVLPEPPRVVQIAHAMLVEYVRVDYKNREIAPFIMSESLYTCEKCAERHVEFVAPGPVTDGASKDKIVGRMAVMSLAAESVTFVAEAWVVTTKPGDPELGAGDSIEGHKDRESCVLFCYENVRGEAFFGRSLIEFESGVGHVLGPIAADAKGVVCTRFSGVFAMGVELAKETKGLAEVVRDLWLVSRCSSS